MFAYCNNNPIVFEDASGYALKPCTTFINDGASNTPGPIGTYSNIDWQTLDAYNNNAYLAAQAINNADIETVYKAESVAFYKQKLVIRHSSDFLTSWSICGIIFLNHSNDNSSSASKERLLNHEYGHVLQEQEIGTPQYLAAVFVPSATYNLLSRKNPVLDQNYYNMPWEYDADVRGGVDREHASWAEGLSFIYNSFMG